VPNLTAHSAADIVRYLLIQQGNGVLPSQGGNWPIYVGSQPGAPDNVITAYDTVGRNQGRTSPDSERQGHDGVSLRIRSSSNPEAGVKARELALALDKVHMETVPIDGHTYIVQTVFRTSGPSAIGGDNDGSSRWIWTINVLVLAWEK
jgi:hypothetical protein